MELRRRAVRRRQPAADDHGAAPGLAGRGHARRRSIAACVLLPAAAALDHPSWVEDRGGDARDRRPRAAPADGGGDGASRSRRCPSTSSSPPPGSVPAERAPLLRAALVLSADHEFNASAFAARVVASTGANLYGATMAGLAAHQRPAPWRADAPGRRAVRRAQEGRRPRCRAGAARARRHRHCRASATRSIPTATSAPRRCSPCCARPCPTRPNSPSPNGWPTAAERLIDRKPNVDFATVTIERVLGLPKDSALAMFLLGRTVGWIAHALEQAAHGGIDPAARALYGSATRKRRQCLMTDALIVIDMQQGSFGPATPRHDAAGLVGRLNRLADAVRADGGAVIFIQHDGPPGDPHHPDSPGWRLLPDLDVRPDDTVIRKESCDAFLHTSLDDVPARAGHRPADRHRLRDRLLRRHHGAQRPGARLSDDRALGWAHHVGPAAPRRRPRSSSITTPSGPTSWRPAGPPWCVPARTCGYPPRRCLASTAPACLTSRFSDKKTHGRAEVAPPSRHRGSVA